MAAAWPSAISPAVQPQKKQSHRRQNGPETAAPPFWSSGRGICAGAIRNALTIPITAKIAAMIRKVSHTPQRSGPMRNSGANTTAPNA